MIGKIGMSDKGVPNSKETSNWSMPDDLMFGRAHTKVDFDMDIKVEVQCRSFLCSHLKMISYNLQS
jgi:hypothetical protein